MPVLDIVRQLLAPVAALVHLARLEAVCSAVVAIILGRKLSVTEMGRNFWGVTKTKHAIKRFDRLVSNPHLASEVQLFFRTLVARLVRRRQHLVIAIDWTHLTGIFHALVATATLDGRSVVLLVEVRPEQQLGNAAVQRAFLKSLKAVLPAHCQPVIVTDAGFHGPFFRAVLENGWDFVGRIRGTAKMVVDGVSLAKSQLYRRASPTAKDLRLCELYARGPLRVRLVLLRKRRSRRPSKPTRNKDLIAYRKAARDPWLLATSLSSHVSAEAVAAIYARRMQIEETFRDVKSDRFGFGLGKVRSGSRQRLLVMLLLGAIAMTVVLLVGLQGESAGAHLGLQANSVKNRRVLSLFTLGLLLMSAPIPGSFAQNLRRFCRLLKEANDYRTLTLRGDP